MYEVILNSEEQTNQLAYKLGKYIHQKALIILTGDLGAGKTTFTKSLARGLGVKEKVNSPTFTILKEYDSGRKMLYHIDAYRLEGNDDDLGLEEFLDQDAVCVIEWPNYIEHLIPTCRLEITIHYIDPTSRKINFYPIGEYYEKLCKEVLNEYTCNGYI